MADTPNMNEPKITINGTELTDAQAMTLRVAAGNYQMDLMRNVLGDDESGKAITRLYLDRLREITHLMQKQT